MPRLLKRLRILEFTLDHEAPYFSNMRRRTSRRDSDLNGVVDVRYTGGARMLLLLEVGGRMLRVKVCLPLVQASRELHAAAHVTPAKCLSQAAPTMGSMPAWGLVLNSHAHQASMVSLHVPCAADCPPGSPTGWDAALVLPRSCWMCSLHPQTHL